MPGPGPKFPPLTAPAGKMVEDAPFHSLRICVMTISDTRTDETDTSGHILADRVKESGHEVADKAIVPDEVNAIRAIMRKWIADPKIDAVVTTGGTGLTGRDVTPEAVRPLFDKEIEGFNVVWHMVSLPVRRHLDAAVPRLRRRRQRHLHLLPAGLQRRREGRLGQAHPLAAR